MIKKMIFLGTRPVHGAAMVVDLLVVIIQHHHLVLIAVLFVPQNVRGRRSNQVVAVQVLHVVANVPQNVRGIQKVVVVQALHVQVLA
ncbi:MAG: hypothetical protein IKQ51_00955 [Bacteroidaceae bacterium]|nr:hypothetical protein [Bacteroidaceae bacterium]